MFSTNKKTGQVFNDDKKPEGPPLSKASEELTEKEKKIIERELKKEKKLLQEASEKIKKQKKEADKAKKKRDLERRWNAIKKQKQRVRKEQALLTGIYEHRVSVDNLDEIRLNDVNSDGKVKDRGSAISLIGL